MSNDFKLIPYGICNFKQVRSENKYLVDKTMYFEQMELAATSCSSSVRAGSARACSSARLRLTMTSMKRTTSKRCSKGFMWLTTRLGWRKYN